MMPPSYTGRFAPSPTGPLHFGSLVAALASYLDARSQGGRWLVRVEDIDPPREVPGATDTILRQLEQHGLCWDGDVMFQSNRSARYEEILDALLADGFAYYCRCSRREIAAIGGIYRGGCRFRTDLDARDTALRVHVPDDYEAVFDDLFQGPQRHFPGPESGDFVVRRRDGFYAYQLAVVVDDMDQGVDHVIRGLDLLETTPRQLWLQTLVGASAPRYGHLPVALNALGQKLSKQNHAPSLDRLAPHENLRLALDWLGQPPPEGLVSVEELLADGVLRWDRRRFIGQRQRPAPAQYVSAR